jgi:hypothetical protein
LESSPHFFYSIFEALPEIDAETIITWDFDHVFVVPSSTPTIMAIKAA